MCCYQHFCVVLHDLLLEYWTAPSGLCPTSRARARSQAGPVSNKIDNNNMDNNNNDNNNNNMHKHGNSL